MLLVVPVPVPLLSVVILRDDRWLLLFLFFLLDVGLEFEVLQSGVVPVVLLASLRRKLPPPLVLLLLLEVVTCKKRGGETDRVTLRWLSGWVLPYPSLLSSPPVLSQYHNGNSTHSPFSLFLLFLLFLELSCPLPLPPISRSPLSLRRHSPEDQRPLSPFLSLRLIPTFVERR